MEIRDQITIDTPEQVALEYKLAGIGSRFMALFVDTMIQWIAIIVIGIIIFLIPTGAPVPDVAPMGKWGVAIVIFVTFSIYWGYFAFFEAIWKGQTPGKRQAKIRVIKEIGREITPFEAITRNLLRGVDWLPGFYGVGIITMFLNQKHRRIGDFAAGTIVVHERMDAPLDTFLTATPGPAQSAAEYMLDTRNIDVNDIQVIEAFMQRRLELEQWVRWQMAEKIASRLAEKVEIVSGTRPKSNEDSLAAIVQSFRSTQRK